MLTIVVSRLDYCNAFLACSPDWLNILSNNKRLKARLEDLCLKLVNEILFHPSSEPPVWPSSLMCTVYE